MEGEAEPLPPGEVVDRLKDAVGTVPGDLLRYAIVLVVAVVVLYIVWRLLRRRRARLPVAEPVLAIDVASLGTWGPPPDAPVLEHYNVPVRLAAIVVAPAGRARKLPPPEQLDAVFEAIVPGLARVVATHATLVRCWPEQLSSTGFAHSLFRHAKLPGDGGKGTPWCSAAGITKMQGQPVMAGLVMRSEEPNSLGQLIVEYETKWLDVLRVKARN